MNTPDRNQYPSLAFILAVLAAAPIHVQAAPSPPSKPLVSIFVQNQPGGLVQLSQPAIAQEGLTVMLSADVQGSEPMVFQWFLNGAAIEGATNRVQILSTSQRADQGAYSVVVTNLAGAATSDSARLLISNVKAEPYMGLLVSASTGGVLQIQYADSLASNALWQPLLGVTSSVAPLVIADPAAPNLSQRFYKTPVAQGIQGRLLPGWVYSDATGSVHAIEFIEPQSGSTNWRALQLLTLPSSPYLFVDATATNGLARHYRTTVLASPATRRVGQLLSTITWILPSDVYTNLSQTDRQALANLGISLNDQTQALQFPTNPLPGYWIVIGDQRVMTRTNGSFQIDVPTGVTNGFAVRSPDARSRQAEASFGVSELAPLGQTPPPIVVRYIQEGILNMDGGRQSPPPGFFPFSPASGPICGNPCATVGNTNRCCLDYDGRVNDGCKYPDDLDSFLQKFVRYIDSTCFRLVNEGLCQNEFNAHTTDPLQYLTGPACFENHKYRNCQNVVRHDLAISARVTTVRCGESIDLTIHNNSWGNETAVSLGPFSLFKTLGTLSGEKLSAGWWPGNFTLRHYDDASRKHFEDEVIRYTAPTRQEIESGAAAQFIQIHAESGGEVDGDERTLEIRVVCDDFHPNFVCSGSGYKEADSAAGPWQSIDYNYELAFELNSRLIQETANFLTYRIEAARGTTRFWGTANYVGSGFTRSLEFDDAREINEEGIAGTLVYSVAEQRTVHLAFPLFVSARQVTPYYVEYFAEREPHYSRLSVQLPPEWWFDDIYQSCAFPTAHFADPISAQGVIIYYNSGFEYDATYPADPHWRTAAFGAYMEGDFSLPSAPVSARLNVRHLTSALAGCPGGGYSPVNITINGNLFKSCYDPASAHGGIHSFVTDEWEIGSYLRAGLNTVRIAICNSACSVYWISDFSIQPASQGCPECSAEGVGTAALPSVLSTGQP